MQLKYLIGLPVLLGIFLLIKSFWKRKSAPLRIAKTFDQVFDASEYKNSKNNWLLVSKMETAGWSSKLFINGLNLWGMKKAKVRPNTQSSTLYGVVGRDQMVSVTGIISEITGQSEWAKYASVEDAVKDIILWMRYTNFPKQRLSLRDHVEAMKARSYFVGEDVSEYLGKILAWENRNVT